MNALAIAISLIAIVIALTSQRGIMDGIERLTAAVTKLNETITTEAAQQKAVVQELRDAINAGANAEKLNLIADDLEASIDRVAAIVPDEAEEPAEETGTGTEG